MPQVIKILTLFSFIIGITAHQANAQSIGYGIKSGLNIANFANSNFDTQNRIAVNIGVYGNVDIRQTPLSVQPELLYTQRGSSSSWQFGDIVRRGTLSLDYIEFPLLLKYTGNITHQTEWYLLTGPSFAYLLRSEFSSLDIEHSTNSTDIGLVGGLGMDLPFISQRLSVEARYTHGFTRIYKSGFNSECCGSFERPQKNSTFSIILGVGL